MTGTSPVSFAAGATTASFTVTPVDDNVEETDEPFTVHADAGPPTLPVGYALSQGADGTGTILNDDASLAIAADVGNGTDEGTGGTTPYLYTVTRTGDTSGVTTVDWAVSSANMNGADFAGGVLPSGSLTFSVGETTKTITINVAADSTVELDEGFSVTLSNAAPSAGTLITAPTATSAGCTTFSPSGAVNVGTGRPRSVIEVAEAVVTRLVEHQMFEQMGKSRLTGLLVSRADAKPGVIADGRSRAVDQRQDGEPVAQLEPAQAQSVAECLLTHEGPPRVAFRYAAIQTLDPDFRRHHRGLSLRIVCRPVKQIPLQFWSSERHRFSTQERRAANLKG